MRISRRPLPLVAAVLALGVLPAPAAADAASGGAAFPEGAPGLEAPRAQLLGRLVRFGGAVPGTAPGDQVVVQRLDRADGWVALAETAVQQDGTIAAAWRADTIGRLVVRAVPAARAHEAQAADAGPVHQLTVFRPARATFFGPGLFGRRTACGQRLTRALAGVAHKTLPCGTKVDLLYRGRTVTVPVVDRGPFRKGTSWDLTWATARALGMRQTATIGAARVRR